MEAGPNESVAESVVSLLDRLTNVEEAVYAGAQDSVFTQTPYPHPPHRQLANPSPLGLFGFAIVSIVSAILKFSRDQAGDIDGVFAAVALFVGGGAQILAAVFQFLLNNAHSATTFALFGLHWSSQGFLIFINALSEASFRSEPRPVSQAAYYAVVTTAATILWIPTFRMNKVLSVTLLFVIGAFAMDIPAAYDVRAAEIVSGICAMVASLLALYIAVLDLVNEAWKRSVLPLFPHKAHREDYQPKKGVPYVPRRTYHKSAVSASHL